MVYYIDNNATSVNIMQSLYRFRNLYIFMFAYDKHKPKRHWQHWAHKTQDEQIQTKHNTENLQDEQHKPHQIPRVNPGDHERESSSCFL